MDYQLDDDFTFDVLELAEHGHSVSDVMATLYKTHVDYSMKDIFGALAAMRKDTLITTSKRKFLAITSDGSKMFSELYDARYGDEEDEDEEEQIIFVEELHFVDSKNFRNPDLDGNI